MAVNYHGNAAKADEVAHAIQEMGGDAMTIQADTGNASNFFKRAWWVDSLGQEYAPGVLEGAGR